MDHEKENLVKLFEKRKNQKKQSLALRWIELEGEKKCPNSRQLQPTKLSPNASIFSTHTRANLAKKNLATATLFDQGNNTDSRILATGTCRRSRFTLQTPTSGFDPIVLCVGFA